MGMYPLKNWERRKKGDGSVDTEQRRARETTAYRQKGGIELSGAGYELRGQLSWAKLLDKPLALGTKRTTGCPRIVNNFNSIVTTSLVDDKEMTSPKNENKTGFWECDPSLVSLLLLYYICCCFSCCRKAQ